MTTKYKQPIQDFIDQYYMDNQRPPTVREISDALGGISTSVVNYSLKNDLGYAPPKKGDSRYIVPQWIRNAILGYKGVKHAAEPAISSDAGEQKSD